MQTHYKTLGVLPNATQNEIKKQFYKLSKLHHPDSKSGSQETFKLISSAYHVLKNHDSRLVYDNSINLSHVSKSKYTSTDYNVKRRKPRYDFDMHQYGHYGSLGSKLREQKLRENRVYIEPDNQFKILSSILFGFGTVLFIFGTPYVRLIWM